MSFHKVGPFGMKFGPVIGNNILIWKVLTLFVLLSKLMCLWIINELLPRLFISPEIRSSNMIWDVDHKNDNADCHIMYINWYIYD